MDLNRPEIILKFPSILKQVSRTFSYIHKTDTTRGALEAVLMQGKVQMNVQLRLLTYAERSDCITKKEP